MRKERYSHSSIRYRVPGSLFSQHCTALLVGPHLPDHQKAGTTDRKSTRLNSSHSQISYAVFCLKKKTATSPRNATNWFEGRALAIRTAPYPRALPWGRFKPFPPEHGIGRGTSLVQLGTYERRL